MIAIAFWFFRSPTVEPIPTPPLAEPARTHTPALQPLSGGELKPGPGSLAIRGLVHGPSGPIAGATLIATRVDAEELESCDGEDCRRPRSSLCDPRARDAQIVEWARARRGEAPPVARAISSTDGRFELAGLETGEHRVWSFAEGVGIQLASSVSAGEQQLQVGYEQMQRITGRVTDARGEAVAGVWVTGFLPRAPRYFDIQTASDGSFELGSFANEIGALSVIAFGPQGVSAHLRQDVLPGTIRYPLVLAALPHAVVRTLEAEADQPIIGAHVTLRTLNLNCKWTTGADGQVEIVLPREPRLELRATSTTAVGKVDLDGTQPIDGPVVIRMREAAFIVGTVRDEAGKPLVARVAALYTPATATSDAQGHFRLGPIEQRTPDETVTAAATGYLNQVLRTSLKPNRPELAFVLSPARKISGHVRTVKGEPIDDAELEVTGPAVPLNSGTSSDSDGAFEIGGLPPGTVTVTVTHPDWADVELEVVAPADAVEIRMKSAAGIDVTVVDEKNRPQSMDVGLASDAPSGPSAHEVMREPRTARTDRQGAECRREASAPSPLPVTQLNGAPFAYPQFRSTLGLEVSF